jgi:hypothetical protein
MNALARLDLIHQLAFFFVCVLFCITVEKQIFGNLEDLLTLNKELLEQMKTLGHIEAFRRTCELNPTSALYLFF